MVLIAFAIVAPLVLLYALAIKGVDRYEPEPAWLLVGTFAWGALVATMAAVELNQLGMQLLSMGLDGAGDPELVEWSTASFVAPFVEESTKGIGLLVLWLFSAFLLQEFDGPLDGVIYGGVIGLGFTLTEDVLYVSNAAQEQGGAGLMSVFILRTVMSGLGHASFTAATGLGIGIAIESRRPIVAVLAPIFGWAVAVGLHAIHNLLATFLYLDGSGLAIKFLFFWLVNILFFVAIIGFALRDRAIVARQLGPEVGATLSANEFRLVVSRMMLVPFWNYLSLRRLPTGYAQARRLQLQLVELAFAKHRKSRGWAALAETREARLRTKIAELRRAGLVCG